MRSRRTRISGSSRKVIRAARPPSRLTGVGFAMASDTRATWGNARGWPLHVCSSALRSRSMARSTNTKLGIARRDADEAKRAIAEAEKSRISGDALQWLDLGERKLLEALEAVQEVKHQLSSVEERKGGPVPLTSRRRAG